ncbi:MAG: hypothetical protein ACRD0H_10150, partial [Actinomycetes bacterium]
MYGVVTTKTCVVNHHVGPESHEALFSCRSPMEISASNVLLGSRIVVKYRLNNGVATRTVSSPVG